MELQRLEPEQEPREPGGVPGQVLGGLGAPGWVVLGRIPCSTSLQAVDQARSVAAPEEYPAGITVNNPGVWILEQDFGRVLGLFRLERSRLFPGSGEI